MEGRLNVRFRLGRKGSTSKAFNANTTYITTLIVLYTILRTRFALVSLTTIPWTEIGLNLPARASNPAEKNCPVPTSHGHEWHPRYVDAVHLRVHRNAPASVIGSLLVPSNEGAGWKFERPSEAGIGKGA